MVVTTYLMREVSHSVPTVVNNIATLWFVCVFLTQPYQPLIGLVIGVVHYLLATTTPNMLGIDFFYPPEPLRWFCQKYLNPRHKLSIDVSEPIRQQVAEPVNIVLAPKPEPNYAEINRL
jgi:hypothetical protein